MNVVNAVKAVEAAELGPAIQRPWEHARARAAWLTARWGPYLTALLAALVVLGAVWLVDRAEQERFQRQHRTEVLHRVSAVRAKLEQALHARLYLAHALAAYAAANPDLTEQAFDGFARGLLARQPDVRHLALARGSLVAYVHPRTGGESILGTDLLVNPAQPAVWRAFQSRQFVLAGPVMLEEGKAVLIGCVPVFAPSATAPAEPERFWGLALIIVDLEPLLGDAGLLDPASGLQWALRGTDGWGELGEPFFGNEALFQAAPEVLEVSLPRGSWQLAAMPAQGWWALGPASWWIRGGGGVLAVLVAILAYVLARDPARLRETVERATTALREQQERLEERVQERTQELQALYRADEELYRHLRLDEVLHALVDVTTGLLKADKVSVQVWDGRREHLVVKAANGFRPETLARMSVRAGEGIAGQVAVSGELVAVEDTLTETRMMLRQIVEAEGIRAFVHVPISVDGQVYGVFNVNYCQPHTFGDDETRVLLALAQRTGLAIENARLYEQAQHAATLEERQRLARELHDSVTQTLFSASLISEVLPRLWERAPEQGHRRLAELQELTRGALAEMRSLLLELRPSALTEVELSDLLRQLGEAVTGRARLPVRLTLEGERETPLPPDVQIAFYRIAQEALNNVVKHAEATEATLSLRLEADGADLRIGDNGKGFDPAAVAGGHLGVGGMRERADVIGATLTIQSRLGEGTTVGLAWRDLPSLSSASSALLSAN